MFVVNASNIIKDFTWIVSQINGLGDVVAVNTSSRYALMAIQGPAARDILQKLTGVNLGDISAAGSRPAKWRRWRGRFRAPAIPGKTASKCSCRRRRPSASGTRSWQPAATRVGARRPRRARHAAARGRDAPSGNDMDEKTTVLEADLGWIVGWKKEEFIGADVLRRQKAEGARAS